VPRLSLLFALLLLAPQAASAQIPDGAFVRVAGTRFVVGKKTFPFVGANMDPLHGELNRARFAEIIKAARADGLTVARVWALGEGAADASPWRVKHELFRVGPDHFLDEPYLLLDHVLAEARARGLRIILTLANHWDDYGGVGAYLDWAGLPKAGFGARDRFFADEHTRALYRAHLDRLLERTNSVTGVRYVDDPTIVAWELMNESQVASSEGAA
jgi:mannan endo-1,4-beta-mannosidase